MYTSTSPWATGQEAGGLAGAATGASVPPWMYMAAFLTGAAAFLYMYTAGAGSAAPELSTGAHLTCRG